MGELMTPFNTLTEAQEWCRANADGDCTLLVQVMRSWFKDELVEGEYRWSMNLQRFVVNF
jgi:hypothetical protein